LVSVVYLRNPFPIGLPEHSMHSPRLKLSVISSTGK
jgi:hypothetical protein